MQEFEIKFYGGDIYGNQRYNISKDDKNIGYIDVKNQDKISIDFNLCVTGTADYISDLKEKILNEFKENGAGKVFIEDKNKIKSKEHKNGTRNIKTNK